MDKEFQKDLHYLDSELDNILQEISRINRKYKEDKFKEVLLLSLAHSVEATKNYLDAHIEDF